MRSVIVAALVLVACGSSHPKADTTRETTHQTKVDGPAPPCPAQFGASGACTVAQSCSYPEGTCACGVQSRCSGYNMSDEQQREWDSHLVWECVKKPPAVRPDHCPGIEPVAKEACPRDGQVCEYPGCISQTYTCTDGKWIFKRGEPPP
jgi:hypothetical protein